MIRRLLLGAASPLGHSVSGSWTLNSVATSHMRATRCKGAPVAANWGSSFLIKSLTSPQSLFVLVKAVVQLRHTSFPVAVPEL